MAVELRRSVEFSLREVAQLFSASYQDYFVPFKVDEQILGSMVEAFDLLLEHSLVAVESGTPVGLVNLGRRGERTWVAGVGVVPASRGRGIGEQLMRGLFDRTRALGAREVVLEVITENAPAIALYEKLGFETVRKLEVLSLAENESDAEADETDVPTALRHVAMRREGREPWQRDDRTVANLAGREPCPQGVVADEAAAVYLLDSGRVGLLQAAGEPAGLRALVEALRRRGTISAVNYPADGAVSAVLREAGAEVVLRQLEMVTTL